MNTAAVSSSVLGSDQPVLDQIIDLSSEPSSMDPKTAMMVTKNNHTLSSADHNNIQGVHWRRSKSPSLKNIQIQRF